MATPIIPRIVRGRLHYQTADVLFPILVQAATAWPAAGAHRLDLSEPIDQLTVQRTEVLAEMRQAGPGTDQIKSLSERIHAVRTDLIDGTAVVDSSACDQPRRRLVHSE